MKPLYLLGQCREVLEAIEKRYTEMDFPKNITIGEAHVLNETALWRALGDAKIIKNLYVREFRKIMQDDR